MVFLTARLNKTVFSDFYKRVLTSMELFYDELLSRNSKSRDFVDLLNERSEVSLAQKLKINLKLWNYLQ